jgi:hypothetical protein
MGINNNGRQSKQSKQNKGKKCDKGKNNEIYIDEYLRKNIVELFQFRTLNKTDFLTEDIIYLDKSVDRINSIEKMEKLTNDYYIAKEIECGIFEFVLTRIKELNIIAKILPNMYFKMLDEIINNLNIKNNPTLLPNILNGTIEPFKIAFFSPHQIHPLKWKKEIDKQIETAKLRDDVPTTDLYKCYKCGARRSIVHQVQIRCADEPMTLFITCIECNNTYTKNG